MSDGVVARISTAIPQTAADNKPEIHHTQQQDTIDKAEVNVIPPFTKYAEIKKVPYSADYFNVKYYNKLSPELDHKDVFKNISEVERYVSERIKDGKLKDDVTTYQQILDAVKRTLGIEDHIKAEDQLRMISQFMKLKTQEKMHNDKLEKIKEGLLKFIGDKRG